MRFGNMGVFFNMSRCRKAIRRYECDSRYDRMAPGGHTSAKKRTPADGARWGVLRREGSALVAANRVVSLSKNIPIVGG